MTECELVLELSFRHVNSISDHLTTKSRYQNLIQFLQSHEYVENSPIELHGKLLLADELRSKISVIDDADTVQVFKVFVGSSFATDDDVFAKIFDKMENTMGHNGSRPDRQFHEICLTGDIQQVKQFLEKYKVDPNVGLAGACKGDHDKVIDLLIQRGADNWNDGLILLIGRRS